MIKKGVKTIFPPGTPGFRVVQAVARFLRLLPRDSKGDAAYNEWIKTTEPYLWYEGELDYHPLISVVVPVFNAPDRYLMPMVYSLVNQTYDNWELVLVNASNQPKCIEKTNQCASIDSRIKVVEISSNKGIAGNTNSGLKAANGDYVGLLDHDDVLSPHALKEVVLALQDAGNRPGLVYSDEDKLSDDGEYRFDPHFKPAWSPQMLKEVNYINHFTVIKKSLLDKIGGYRTGYDGAQDYDLYLRLVDQKPLIITHIPKVLYHWRAAKGSTAKNFSSKSGIIRAGQKALADHLERNGQQGVVKAIPKEPGFYGIEYALPEGAKGSLVIFPAKDRSQLHDLVSELLAYRHRNNARLEIVSQPLPQNLTAKYEDVDFKAVKSDSSKGFLKKALELVEGDFVIGINAGVVPKHKTWIDKLGGLVCQEGGIGAAGPMLINTASPNTIVDAGYVDYDDRPIPLFQGSPKRNHTYFGNADWVRNVEALNGKVWVCTKSCAKKYCDDQGPNYKAMVADGLQVVFWPFVLFDYVGDLQPRVHNSVYFSGLLFPDKPQLSLARTIDMSAHRSDDDD